MKQPPRLNRRKDCGNKVRHGSFEQALAHKAELVAGGAYEPQLRVYQCPRAPQSAPHWHVGHARGSAWSR